MLLSSTTCHRVIGGRSRKASSRADRPSSTVMRSFRVLREHRPDAVLHFAALTIAPESVHDPAPYWRVNTGGTLNLLDAVGAADVSVLVFSSTAAVYGAPDRSQSSRPPLAADQSLRRIEVGRRAGDARTRLPMAWAFAALRYFNVAGASRRRRRGSPSGDASHPQRARRRRRDGASRSRSSALTFPLPDGTAIRDYVHVEDLIDAHLLALDRYAAAATRSARSISARGTALRCAKSSTPLRVSRASGARVYSRRARPGDPATLVADATRARRYLGGQPTRSTLDEMMAPPGWRRGFPQGYGDDQAILTTRG